MIFEYRSKGTNDDWTTDTVEAEDEKAAVAKLDTIYGIERDEASKQTTPNIWVELIEASSTKE